MDLEIYGVKFWFEFFFYISNVKRGKKANKQIMRMMQSGYAYDVALN